MDICKNTTPQPKTWIFDLDNTIYPARCNLFAQIDVRMGNYICSLLSVDRAEAKRIQKSYLMSHGTTLRGLMDHHGVEPEGFMHYVHDIDLSALPQDAELNTALHLISGRKIIYTNGSRIHAERVLTQMGLSAHFEDIFDIAEADYRPKPALEPFADLLKRYKITPQETIMIDDMAVNLMPAHKLGLQTLWIKTDSPYGCKHSDGDHIHHVAEDLKSWLQNYLKRQEI